MQISGHGIGDFLSAAAWEWPSCNMPRQTDHQAEGCAGWSIEGQHGVRGEAGEKGTGALPFKFGFRDTSGRTYGTQSKRSQDEGMHQGRYPQGTKERVFDDVPMPDQRIHHLFVCDSITAQGCRRLLY